MPHACDAYAWAIDRDADEASLNQRDLIPLLLSSSQGSVFVVVVVTLTVMILIRMI